MIQERQIPADYPSAHGAVWFSVWSDKTGEPNFKYVFDLYIDGVLIARIKQWPEPQYGLGLFNAAPVLRTYLDNNYFTGHEDLVEVVTADGHFQKNVQIKYGEEYGIPVTTYTNVLAGTEVTAYNYYDDIFYRRLENSLSPLADSFLTTAGDNKKVTLQDNHYLFYWNKAGVPVTITVEKFGGTTGTVAFTPDVAELYSLNAGPQSINSHVTGFIDEGNTHYTLTVDNGTTSTMKTFKVTCGGKFPNYNLVFLNQWGGFDTAPFRFLSRRKAEMERKTFSKRNYRYDNLGNVSYNEANGVLRGNTAIHATNYKHKYHLTTDLLTDNEFKWLFQLVNSPVVYLEVKKGQYIISEEGEYVLAQDGTPIVTEYGTTLYYPVKVESNSYDFKTRRADKLNALEIDLEILENFNSQYA